MYAFEGEAKEGEPDGEDYGRLSAPRPHPPSPRPSPSPGDWSAAWRLQKHG